MLYMYSCVFKLDSIYYHHMEQGRSQLIMILENLKKSWIVYLLQVFNFWYILVAILVHVLIRPVQTIYVLNFSVKLSHEKTSTEAVTRYHLCGIEGIDGSVSNIR